mgnify:CR=1 FL=1
MLKTILKFILIIVVIIIVYLLIVNYWPKGGSNVVFNTASGAHKYAVEVSDNKDTRTKGLMERDSLDKDKGMIFIFEEERIPAFWMKNMRFPLDMVFMDKNLKVVDYYENVPACKADPCPHYMPSTNSKYVVEVNAGTIKESGLTRGDIVEYK